MPGGSVLFCAAGHRGLGYIPKTATGKPGRRMIREDALVRKPAGCEAAAATAARPRVIGLTARGRFLPKNAEPFAVVAEPVSFDMRICLFHGKE
mgnify:CR=1 FL=1